ncbi:hypothetical protein EI555_006922, partial [Monodon monoceros]
STSCAINSQYYSRTFINTSNWRDNFSTASALPQLLLHSSFLPYLTILEFAVAIIEAYVFTLLVSLYLHDNNNDPPDPHMPHSKAQSLTPYRSPFSPPNNIGPNHPLACLLLESATALRKEITSTYSKPSLLQLPWAYILHSYKPQSIMKLHLQSQMEYMDQLSSWPQGSMDCTAANIPIPLNVLTIMSRRHNIITVHHGNPNNPKLTLYLSQHNTNHPTAVRSLRSRLSLLGIVSNTYGTDYVQNLNLLQC